MKKGIKQRAGHWAFAVVVFWAAALLIFPPAVTALAAGSSTGGQTSGGSSSGSGSGSGGGPWWAPLDGRVYNFKDTNVSFSLKKGKLATDWQYMMGAGYPVEPVKFRSPRRLVAVFEFDCGLMTLTFRPDLKSFSVSTNLWETGSHCEVITGEGRLKSRR